MTDPSELPSETRVAAYGLCFDDADRFLLVRIAPGFTRDAEGKWTLPGGGLKFGEDPERGALRELEEETGFSGEIERIAFVSSFTRGPLPDDGYGPFHSIRIVYHIRITGGALRHEVDESTDMAAWIAPDEMASIQLVELAKLALEYLKAKSVAVEN